MVSSRVSLSRPNGPQLILKARKPAALIDALRNGGDLLNVFGDFPTLNDPRHADAYSPLWDAQLGQWTDKAIKEGFDKRQIDEVEVFNLAATRPDLLTGPGGAPYGSAGVDLNCAVIGFIEKAVAQFASRGRHRVALVTTWRKAFPPLPLSTISQ